MSSSTVLELVLAGDWLMMYAEPSDTKSFQTVSKPTMRIIAAAIRRQVAKLREAGSTMAMPLFRAWRVNGVEVDDRFETVNP